MKSILDVLSDHPTGLPPSDLERHLGVGRTTLLRMLKDAGDQVEAAGNGSARIYRLADPFLVVRRYMDTPVEQRPVGRFDESYLFSVPTHRFEAGVQLGRPLDKYEFSKFLLDFSCASSMLEGGTYSLLDTETLLSYGSKAQDKPLKDAFLVLNHKEAFEYLHDHLSFSSIFKVHDLLTNDHDFEELKEAEHFLPPIYRGIAREYEDVSIFNSSYMPPFRPGTGYIGKSLQKVLDLAQTIEDPLTASFYLMTRLPYLQPFKDGNKRVARAMCNVPLLVNCLYPISFVDFNKADYVLGMKALYELQDDRIIAKCFQEAYLKSCERLRPPVRPKFR